MKKHKILKGILIGVAVILILLAVHFTRNYIIINEIIEKQSELENCTNFYYVIEFYTAQGDELESTTSHYCKDGKSKITLDVDGTRKMILWRDAETGEEIFVIPQASQAIISNNEVSPWYSIPLLIDSKESNYWAISTIITNDNIDGKECYKINLGEAKYYISKENGIVLKSMDSKTVIDGEEHYNVIDYKDWKFNELEDEDLVKPDLTGYEVKYSEEE